MNVHSAYKRKKVCTWEFEEDAHSILLRSWRRLCTAREQNAAISTQVLQQSR
jgi:hypothetical protein